MKWVAIRPKILEIISKSSNVHTCWRDKPQDFVVPDEYACFEDEGVTIKLHAMQTRSVGRDDFRTSLNATTHLLDITQAGNRAFTVACLAESFDQSDSAFCLEYTERVRSALQRPQVLAMLREVNLTVTDVANSVDVSYMQDQRQVSAANVDISFSYAYNQSKGFGLEALDWIEKVGEDPNAAIGSVEATDDLEG